jgi:hypothetical protein
MVADLYKKVKTWCSNNRNDLFIAGIIFFTGLSGFGLGRLSIDLKPNLPLSVVQPTDEQTSETNVSDIVSATDTRVVASRNGTTYYHPWCSGIKRIKEENKIWFTTKETAQKAGLKPAGGCQGL